MFEEKIAYLVLHGYAAGPFGISKDGQYVLRQWRSLWVKSIKARMEDDSVIPWKHVYLDRLSWDMIYDLTGDRK